MTNSTVIVPHANASAAAAELTLFRLYTLRLCYLILVVGLGVTIWPAVVSHDSALAIRSGIKLSLLAGLAAASVLGLRYPVKMLPLLLFEFVWKAIYLTAFALPMWRSHQITPAMAEDVFACATVVVFLPLIPWSYVLAQYGFARGDRWK